MTLASAEAATVAGLAQVDLGIAAAHPPLKLRFAVDMVRSPGAMHPSCAPRHGPQPGFNSVAPAAAGR